MDLNRDMNNEELNPQNTENNFKPQEPKDIEDTSNDISEALNQDVNNETDLKQNESFNEDAEPYINNGMSADESANENIEQISNTETETPNGQFNEENKTPYQTPVREDTMINNPFRSEGPFNDNNEQTGEIPNYNSYKQWQEQFNMEKKKKRGKKPLIIAAGIIVTVMIFTAGALVGGIGNVFLKDAGQANVSQSVELPKDTPKVEIKHDVSTLSAGYDGLTGSEIFKKVAPSIVSIQAESMRTGEGSYGSGIIMKENGYIITNNHVVEGADKVTVVLNDGKKYEAEIIGLDKKTDLAVVKINATGLKPAEFGDSTKLVVGDRAFAIGSPGGIQLQNTFTGGYISAINRDITIDDRVMTLLQTDASINPGNSGGALINQYGQVIGVTSAKLGISYYEGLGFAIPMSTAEGIINELIAYGYVTGRPAIGISGYNITDRMATYYQVPEGVLIDAVDSRSDAYAKGVKRGDIITGINGTEIKSMTEVNAIKNKMKAGDNITLNIYRAGKKMDIKIKLMDEKTLETIVREPEKPQTQESEFDDPFNSPFFQFP